MKKLLITFFTVLFCLTSSVGWSLTFDELVHRGGLYYEKFSDEPFSGKVEGKRQGSMKKGKKEGSWVYYHVNGHLFSKGVWKNGRKDGSWISYHLNGQLWFKGDYNDGKRDGSWIGYNNDGSIWKQFSGTFKDGVEISD